MEARVQRVLIWCGPAMFVLWVGAFFLIAEFFPPHDPSANAQTITDIYLDHTDGIRLGMVIVMAASALLVPWAVAISGQLKRIEGAGALATVQMASCALLSLEFITPIGVWMAASFRVEDQTPQVTQALSDLGWILFVTVIWSVWVQMLAIGTAILIDKREQPILPRWAGYLNFWVALVIIPAGLVLFFKNGAFAWNGAIGLYVPLAAFGVWVISMSTVVHHALQRQIADGTEPGH